MKINHDFTIQKVGGSYIAVPVGETSKQFRGMVKLNETAAFLWKQMETKDCTEEDLADALVGEYEVDRETALADVQKIVAYFRQYPIFETV